MVVAVPEFSVVITVDAGIVVVPREVLIAVVTCTVVVVCGRPLETAVVVIV